MGIHVVLVYPEIHWNTGNAARSCLAAGATLHLVEPLGFSLEERKLKRAALDYWEHVQLVLWPDWTTFEKTLPELGESFFFTARADQPYWNAPLGATQDVVLVFGGEANGLPDELLEQYSDRVVAIPMLSPHIRSLNLSTCVGIALYEVLRQRAARK